MHKHLHVHCNYKSATHFLGTRVRSCHDDITAVVRVSGGTTDEINIRNGLRQGCTMAPVLFNLYLAAMITCWRGQCPEDGVTVRYKIGRKLVGDRTVKARLESNKSHRVEVCQ